MTIDKEELMESLRTSKTYVKFTKVDGTIRDMVCTTNMYMIPEEYHPKITEVVKDIMVLPTAIRVFDLENSGWRSFKLESVISFL